MKFSLSKLKMAFGKQESQDNPEDNTYINDIIKSIEQKPFAISNDNVCYASANELAGYYYLQTVIVGKFKVKTFDGAQLKVLGSDIELNLESDMMELESELSNVPKSYMTRIDFMLNKKDLPKIARAQLHTLILSAKKQKIEFSIIQMEEKEAADVTSNNEQDSIN